MEAVMEAVAERESARESSMRKPRSESAVRKTRTAKMTTAEVPSSHAAEVRATTEMTAATTEMTATAAVPAATTAASSERRWRKGK
jgi:hypothetical protein